MVLKQRVRRGDRIKIIAPLGSGDEDGETIVRKGDVGTAVGVNCEYKQAVTGEPMIALDVDGVGIAAVPKAAVKMDSGKTFFFLKRK